MNLRHLTISHVSTEVPLDGVSLAPRQTDSDRRDFQFGSPQEPKTRQSLAVSQPPLREPWFRPDPGLAETFITEARREIQPGHELHDLDLVECIARCAGCDDTVFRCSDESFAVVHLSWQENERPPWPNCTRAGSFTGIELVMDQHEH